MNSKSFRRNPYYLEIREHYYNKIVNGEYKAGDKLPSEDDIASFFGVSRVTVNKALSELITTGYLIREHGRGTFVSKLRREGTKTDILGLHESLLAKGFSVESEILVQEHEIPFKEISELMEIPITGEVFHLKRLRKVNGDPITIQDTFISGPFSKEMLDIDFTENSLYGTLKNKYNREIVRARDVVEAIVVNDDDCQLLNIPKGSISLKTRRKAYDNYDNLIEITYSIYRQDQYQLEIDYHRFT